MKVIHEIEKRNLWAARIILTCFASAVFTFFVLVMAYILVATLYPFPANETKLLFEKFIWLVALVVWMSFSVLLYGYAYKEEDFQYDEVVHRIIK